MKKTVITLMTVAASLGAQAQEALPTAQAGDTVPAAGTLLTAFDGPFIGCLSYDEALKAMPQYAAVEEEMATLQQAYADELKRAEDEFNKKYEAFLEGRKDFPRTILLKRQNELQQLLQRNVEFKEKSRKELAQARKDKLAPLHARLSQTISEVARLHGLLLVVNTDSEATPFIEPAAAVNISLEVKMHLGQQP